MGVLNRDLIYAIADVLGTNVTHNKDSHSLAGKETRSVNLSGLNVEVSCEIVSSQIEDECVMVIARSIGNVALFVVAKEVRRQSVVDLHVLNIAKMGDAPGGWLEKHRPKKVNDVLTLLGPAVVASFVKIKKNEWSKAA